MHRRNPLFQGWLRSTYDALLVFEAVRRGLIPRVTRRFHDVEKRDIIQSGSIFVFSEEESGIRRWTDPFLWSASRMLENFLIYREKEDGEAGASLPYMCLPLVTRNDATVLDPLLEKDIYGSWNKGKGLKVDGMMKKTMSLTIDGITYHLVAYYRPSDVHSGKLKTPSDVHEFSSLHISPTLLSDLSQFRHPPNLEVEFDGNRNYVADQEETISTADFSSTTLYLMPPTLETSPSPKLYTPISDVPYCINGDEYITLTPSPTSTTFDLPQTPELTPSSTFNRGINPQIDRHRSDVVLSMSPWDEHRDESPSYGPHRCQIQPTDSWQYTSDHHNQAFLDPFRLAYNSPVFWDITWGGPHFEEQPWDQTPFDSPDLLG